MTTGDFSFTLEDVEQESAVAPDGPDGAESTTSPGPSRRTRKRRSDAGTSRSSRPASTAKAPAGLKDALLDPMAKLAMGIGMAAPTVSAVLMTRGESTADALVRLAEGHPRMLAALTRASKVGPGTELAQTAVMLVVALQLDAKRMQPTSPIAMVTGVGELYAQLHPEEFAGAGMPGDFAPPPGFNGVLNEPIPDLPNDPRHPMFGHKASKGAAALNLVTDQG